MDDVQRRSGQSPLNPQDNAGIDPSTGILRMHDSIRNFHRQILQTRLLACIQQFASEQGGLAWEDVLYCLHDSEAALMKAPILFVLRGPTEPSPTV